MPTKWGPKRTRHERMRNATLRRIPRLHPYQYLFSNFMSSLNMASIVLARISALITRVFQENSHALTPVNSPPTPISADVLKLSAFTLMSHTQSAATSSSKFHVSFNNALDTFKKHTGEDIFSHPLAAQLQACDTPAAILTILRERICGLDQSQSGAERWSKWLDPTVNVIFAFSATIEADVCMVCLRNCTHSRSTFLFSFARYFLPQP